MCDRCPFSEKIAEQQAKTNPKPHWGIGEEEPEKNKKPHWQVVDLKTGRSYLGSKSFVRKTQAEAMLNDLLKYHADTEWAERLVVLPGCELKQKSAHYNPDAKNLRGRPKGCTGHQQKSRFRSSGVDWGLKMGFK